MFRFRHPTGVDRCCRHLNSSRSRHSPGRMPRAGGIQMSTTAIDTSGMSESEHSSQLRKAIVASTIGTAIEWYDFFLYGTAAGLVFGKLYFPNNEPTTATLLAFSTYFVGFAARPIGAAIFGHYGDRI